MLKLRNFCPNDADIVAGWLKDEYIFKLWSAGKYKEFPILGSHMIDYYKNHPECRAFVAYEDAENAKCACNSDVLKQNDIDKQSRGSSEQDDINNKNEQTPVGHFMISPIADREDSALLGSIIVTPESRGKGYGKKMLLLATDLIFKSKSINRIVIRVFSQNKQAISCYTSCGFKTSFAEAEAKTNDSSKTGYTYYKDESTNKAWKLIEMKLLRSDINDSKVI